MACKSYAKVNGVWEVAVVHGRTSGAWHKATGVWSKAANVWTNVCRMATFSSRATDEGDIRRTAVWGEWRITRDD